MIESVSSTLPVFRAQCPSFFCVLLYRSRHDSHGHECIILNGTVQEIQDERKSFVFYLSCTGVQNMYFAVEDEDVYLEWLSKLRSACASGKLQESVKITVT